MALTESPAAAVRPQAVLAIDPERYRCHPLHDESRAWRESNCAADLWIETLHALGLDPTLALGFTLSAAFDGEQWRMFTFDAGDLRRLFGIEYDELNVWRPLAWHLQEQVALGCMVSVDVDAWYLPDTAGLTYRTAHQKTTIMVQMIDVAARRLGYFHNTGYYQLTGDDFDGLLGAGVADPAVMPPYADAVRLDRVRAVNRETEQLARRIGAEHLNRRARSNPIMRMLERIDADISWVADEGMDTFHRYAFGSLRQCGSGTELGASYIDWLASENAAFAPAAEHFRAVSGTMKSLEFVLARRIRGRSTDLETPFTAAAREWDAAMEILETHYD